ncbi:MAG: helix-turn-helix transcriptional regulator [Ignavibacteriae bacterium]|nr:helix-turn-helix transcriptional regulator [Ignavibacteriota bacterium]
MKKSEPVVQAIEWIQEHWKEGKSLKEIATMFQVNETTLEHAFHESVGMTVKHFIDTKRKEFVLQALRDGYDFGYEVGQLIGFKSDRAFYRWTERVFEKTLWELRKK